MRHLSPHESLGITLANHPLGLASSLLSVAWSRDNPITGHPARLYDGKVQQVVTQQSLPAVVRLLEQELGPVSVQGARLGVHGWKLDFRHGASAHQLQFPGALDEAGSRGRCRRLLPQLNLEHQRSFIRQGLERFAAPPERVLRLGNSLPVALFDDRAGYAELLFARGGLCVRQEEGAQSWRIDLDPPQTADLIAEMIAALCYYYEPNVKGGSTIVDVSFNDGDFLVRRRADGSFDLKLTQVRERESGVSPQLLLLYLVQLVAYEFWQLLGAPVGIPVVASNPQVAFEGLLRGRRYRALDLGRTAAAGETEALTWLVNFGRSPQGRAYRPWVERFLAGELPLEFGSDLRERAWRLGPLEQQRNILELRHRQQHGDRAALDATAALLDQLRQHVGEMSPLAARTLNGWTREHWLERVRRAGVGVEQQARLVDELLANWPYRNREQLEAKVPHAVAFGLLEGFDATATPQAEQKSSLIPYGHAVSEEDAGTSRAFPSSKTASSRREFANADWYDAVFLPESLHEDAAREFLSFEQYMDDALHDAAWGYYAHAVSIGRRGHFTTHPEALTPHYGRWVARWAYTAWCELCEAGQLRAGAPFAVVEFGAGNGRLARDFIDALAPGAPSPEGVDERRWSAFAQCVQYRIYERSQALRERQRQLLGRDAQVSPGDARAAQLCLAQDYPGGLQGVVLSNELPDAFGCHKVVLSPKGEALAAVVLPRIEPVLREALSAELAQAIAKGDRSLRQRFGLGLPDPSSVSTSKRHPAPGWTLDDCSYLDASTFALLMRELAQCPQPLRNRHLQALWFQEAYVSAGCFPQLAQHLHQNAEQYAVALAAGDSGVLLYVNLHANAWTRGVASALRCGFILTIDYGDSTWGLVQGARRGDFRFRVYGDNREEWLPRPNNPYSLPGTQDMTADVNFTDLAQAARSSGLHVVHFGLESDLVGAELPGLLDRAEQAPFDDLIGNPAFKVLVTGTHRSNLLAAPLAIPLELTRDSECLASHRRDSVAAIRARLTGAASTASG